MRSQFARSGLLAAGVLLALGAAAAEPQVSLTVYSSAQPGGIPAEWYRPLPGMGTPQASGLPGFALVRLDRDLEFTRGRGMIRLTDVAALIDPTTVQFLSLNDAAGTKVLEQNFQFDLVSQDKLLSRYVDRPVSVEQIDAAMERIQEKLLNSGAKEVPSTKLGELVMRELKRIDKVAYVRFASVYRSFEDVDEFRQLIRDI